MRPIHLVVQAFGPYADVQVFDFRDLGNHTFFLIHGDTGAGKSTILDAMCYALYGDSSGGERTALQLRSHHAPPHRRTSVVFDFAIGADLYRVSRSPEHERPKQRGTGMVTESQSARIWLRNGCENEHDNGEILAERWEQVNRHVIELLGFQCNQFRQVVVLPQGQFRDFLIAPSNEREQILSVLFKTDEYRQIELALKNAANAIAREQRLQSQRLTDLYERAEVTGMAALQQERDQRANDLVVLREQLGSLRAAADEAQRRLQEGQETQRKLSEREQSEQALAALDARQAEMDAQRIELDRGRRAASLADIELAVEQRLAEARAADQDREQARTRYDAALVARDQARDALTQEEQRETARETARAHVTQLREIAQRIGDLELAQQKHADAEQRVQSLSEERTQLRTTLQEYQQTLDVREQTVIRACEQAAQREVCALRLQRTTELYQQRERLEAVSADLMNAEQAETGAAQRLADAEQAYQQGQQRLEITEHAWYAGQAGVLGQQLVLGAPCPVCGSCEHPQPAAVAPDVPTEAALRRQREMVRKHEAARNEAQQAHHEQQRRIGELRTERTALVTNMGEHHGTSLEVLGASRDAAKRDHEVAQAAQAALPQHEQEHTSALELVAQATQQLTALDARYGTAVNEYEAARAVLMERERGVPEELRTREAVDAATTTAEQERNLLIEALEAARRQATDTEADVAGSESTWAARIEAADQARQRVQEQQTVFFERLIGQGFVDRDDYLNAKRSPAALDTLDQQITAYEHERAIAANRLAQALIAAQGLVPPDLEALAAVAQQSRQSYESALQREAALGEQLTQYGAWCEEAEQLSTVIDALQHRYEIMGEVARIANGDNPYRISFQRFVLAALLDEVLINASHRLQAMSCGRYTLQRVLGQLDRRQAGGLELEVSDLYTGRSRLAKTLSGGESFLASLALALGLADVVQSHTGGIHLETMFIDEGFGSLDERTLDQALQTLSDLQQGGRLVGIISHVTELQRRIAARLEVMATPSGSTARFVIGSAT